jgi:tetratricopeptide (TPR) repeat protein
MCREIGDARGIAYALGNLGGVIAALGEKQEAERLYQESLTIRREIGDRRGIIFSLAYLGDLSCDIGDCQEARHYYHEALWIAMDIRALTLALSVLVRFARLLASEGEPERAWELLVLILRHPAANRETKDDAHQVRALLDAQLSRDAIQAAQERGRARTLEVTVEELLRGEA